jgi:YfiH family protein
MSPSLALIRPRWGAPVVVQAASTTRAGGVSTGASSSLDLGESGGAEGAALAENRRRLQLALALPESPRWLHQVHGVNVVDAATLDRDGVEADAVFSRQPGRVCAVRSADCLPVLLCDDAGSVVAAAHAGWRGLAAGVLEATIQAMAVPAARLHSWLGPAISAPRYEVGNEVRTRFLAHSAQAAGCFRPTRPGHWLGDLEGLARQRLRALGVGEISGAGLCTFSDARRFFSHRREPGGGRMASLIWINPGA